MYWGRLRGVLPYLGGSWRRLEASCKRLEAVLGVVGGVLKRLERVLKPSWGILERLRAVLEPSLDVLGTFWSVLGRSKNL